MSRQSPRQQAFRAIAEPKSIEFVSNFLSLCRVHTLTDTLRQGRNDINTGAEVQGRGVP
jgi:hypothetical protein